MSTTGKVAFFAAGYFILIGYTIGKKDLDVRMGRAIKAGATQVIAYAKSVPPALPEGYRLPTAAELAAMTDEQVINGTLVPIEPFGPDCISHTTVMPGTSCMDTMNKAANAAD